MENEIWLPVKNFESRFIISNYGRIISIGGRHKGQKLLTPHLSKLGYYETQLRMKPLNRKVRVHTLVAETFLIKPNEIDICVNHKDGNKLNNYVGNLEWISNGDNVKHAVRIGLFNIKGENHPNSKLTKEDVIKIRSLYPSNTHLQIAKMYGMCRRQIGDIINRKNWGWLN